MPLDNNQHERYAVGVASGLGKGKAYRAAGYTGDPAGGKHSIEKKKGVVDRVQFLQRRSADKAIEMQAYNIIVTRNDLNHKFELIFQLAIKGSPVLAKNGEISKVSILDDNGVPTGEKRELRRPDLSAANTAIMGLAKINGLALDVAANAENLDDLLNGMSNADMMAKVVSFDAKIHPNRRKMQEAKAEKEAIIDVEAVKQDPEAVTLQ